MLRMNDENVSHYSKETNAEISGEKIGNEYGVSVVEAHYIDYFTLS